MPKYMCDPAKQILDGLYARGMEFNGPTLEFPEPLPPDRLGALAGYTLVRQFVVKAAAVQDATGIARAGVLFTGQDVYGGLLPPWLYLGDEDDMARLNTLVTDMTALALRQAARERAGRDG
jgi:hypothetical protein